jgi:hypothetical protein
MAHERWCKRANSASKLSITFRSAVSAFADTFTSLARRTDSRPDYQVEQTTVSGSMLNDDHSPVCSIFPLRCGHVLEALCRSCARQN